MQTHTCTRRGFVMSFSRGLHARGNGWIIPFLPPPLPSLSSPPSCSLLRCPPSLLSVIHTHSIAISNPSQTPPNSSAVASSPCHSLPISLPLALPFHTSSTLVTSPSLSISTSLSPPVRLLTNTYSLPTLPSHSLSALPASAVCSILPLSSLHYYQSRLPDLRPRCPARSSPFHSSLQSATCSPRLSPLASFTQLFLTHMMPEYNGARQKIVLVPNATPALLNSAARVGASWDTAIWLFTFPPLP